MPTKFSGDFGAASLTSEFHSEKHLRTSFSLSCLKHTKRVIGST
ncbi:hypothetical protein ACP4OV_017148 [Aristida adscensionis]